MSTAPKACKTQSACRNGIVSTPHSAATKAGLDILRKGGTAVDAAIAAAAVLSVVYPHMCGIGGDAFWLVYSGGNKSLKTLDACGTAAATAFPEFYESRGFSAIPARGYLAVNTVPGAVAGWGEAFTYSKEQLHSPLTWAELLAPAHGYAQDGFVVGASLARWLKLDTSGVEANRGLHQFTCFHDIFCKNGDEPYAEGDILRQEDLAKTFKRLMEHGASDFYTGEICRAIADSMMLHSALLTVSDLYDYRAKWDEPLRATYRDRVVAAPGPVSQGITALEMLQALNHFDLNDIGEGSADYYHLIAETARLAGQDRDTLIGDPTFASVPTEHLLSAEHARKQAASIDLHKSGNPSAPLTPGGDTVWVGVMDAAGNAISMLQSIYHEFGSGMVAAETGILLQNRGCAFSLDPNHVNCLAPGKRTMHTLCPAMIFKDGELEACCGSMGGQGQPQAVTALTTRLVDFGFTPQAAVDAPRTLLGRSWGAPDNDLKLEGRISELVAEDLSKRGHTVRRVADFDEIMGHAGVVRRSEDGSFDGAADPRGDGSAEGW